MRQIYCTNGLAHSIYVQLYLRDSLDGYVFHNWHLLIGRNQLQQDLLMTFDLLDEPDLLHSKTKFRNDNDCDTREHLGYRRTKGKD